MGGPATGRPFSLAPQPAHRTYDKKYQCYVVVIRRSRTVKIALNRSASVPSIFRRLFRNKQAATLIEYSLIAGLIAVATASGMGAIGNGLKFVMGSAANAMH